MKTILPLCFFLLIINLQAQTLTQAFNEPKVGDVSMNVRLDTSGFTGGLPISMTGANKNFDFSKLKTASDPVTTSYLAPSSSTSSPTFTGVTMIQQGNGLQAFLKSATTPTTQTELLGLISSTLSVTFTNTGIAAVYPISFGSTNSDNVSGPASIGTTTTTCNGKLSYTADATGTLTLPDGFVYNNVIRVKSILSFSATISLIQVTIKQTTFDYYDVTKKFPILTINYQTVGSIFGPTVSAVVSGNSSSYVGINENQILNAEFLVYPNPASDFITVGFAPSAEVMKIKITDILGNQLESDQSISGEYTIVDTQALSNGIYFLNVYAGNRIVQTKKVVIDR